MKLPMDRGSVGRQAAADRCHSNQNGWKPGPTPSEARRLKLNRVWEMGLLFFVQDVGNHPLTFFKENRGLFLSDEKYHFMVH